MHKAYRVRDEAPEGLHKALAAHPEIVRELLFARGIVDPDTAQRFLTPHFERDSHDPFLMPDMERAADRVIAAIESNELIAVWSDYDCDGIPGGVALSEFLRDIGARVRHYIPHRHEEGYGLNTLGLTELAKEGVSLVITVDLGTTDHAHIDHAYSLGMETIVTDHHLPQETLPNAVAVLNPHRGDNRYPFVDLCGAGVAWKLIQGILSKNRFGLSVGKEKWLLDLVGLATLSDMVSLTGENRMLASYGLLVMRRARREGLRSLLSLLRINPRTLSEDDVTFMVTPRINAASRMERPETAARLLAVTDREEALQLAQTLNRINDERKGVVAAIVKEARGRLQQHHHGGIIVMGNPKWRPGVLGLVANTLMQNEQKPVFLWGREGGELLKGSCRSNGVNVVSLMSAAKDIFADFGGHQLSGGFSIEQSRAHELAPALEAALRLLTTSETVVQEIVLDRELSLSDVPSVMRGVKLLSPFGEGNRKPLFLFPNLSVGAVRTFGKNSDHLEIGLSRESDTLSGISFFSTRDSFQKPVTEGMRADVVAHLEQDFRGRPRLRIVDVI